MKEQCSESTSSFLPTLQISLIKFILALTLLASFEMWQVGNSAGKQFGLITISQFSSATLSLPYTVYVIHTFHPNLRPMQSEIPTFSLRYN